VRYSTFTFAACRHIHSYEPGDWTPQFSNVSQGFHPGLFTIKKVISHSCVVKLLDMESLFRDKFVLYNNN